MQNDFVRVGAPLEVADARATLSAHRALLDAFRRRGFPVVYTKFITRPGYTLLWEWSPQCRPPTRCCWKGHPRRSEEHTSELQSRLHLVCRLLLEKKKKKKRRKTK